MYEILASNRQELKPATRDDSRPQVSDTQVHAHTSPMRRSGAGRDWASARTTLGRMRWAGLCRGTDMYFDLSVGVRPSKRVLQQPMPND